MRFTEDHEWLRAEGDTVTIGITRHAAEQLGDVVFVEAKAPGTSFAAGDEIAVIESVKAASEIAAPLAGTVLEVNETLAANPALVNEDPTGAAWFLKVRLDDPSALDGLMDEAAYDAMIA